MEMDDLPIRATFSNDERIASRQVYRLVRRNAHNRVETGYHHGRIRYLQDRMFAESRSIFSATKHSFKIPAYALWRGNERFAAGADHHGIGRVKFDDAVDVRISECIGPFFHDLQRILFWSCIRARRKRNEQNDS